MERKFEPVKDASKEVFTTEIRKDLIDESKAVDCVLRPNHCSIHHAKAHEDSLRRAAKAAAKALKHAKSSPDSTRGGGK